MDGGAWKAAVHGVAEGWTQLSDFPFTFHFHALEKEMATHSSVLAWRIPGMGESGGLPSMGSHRVGHDWSDLAIAAAECTKQSLQEQSTCCMTYSTAVVIMTMGCRHKDWQTSEEQNRARNGPELNLIFFFNKVPEQSSGRWEVFSAGATGKTGYTHGWGGNMTHSLPHITYKN